MHNEANEQLSDLFGSYKAEWLREGLFDLFTEPSYFPELVTDRPCVLVGGRGTGKTTVLRCLSYEGQYALRKQFSVDPATAAYFGFYSKVNTNRVTTFRGSELPESDWVRLFSHYMNIDLCSQAIRFLEWHQMRMPGLPQLDPAACGQISSSLNIRPACSLPELSTNLKIARIEFEAYINNIVDASRPKLSMRGAPVDLLMEYIGSLSQFDGKRFFFLIDEYENFEFYQQQIVNTLIKHAGSGYTFKVGVRDLGWRCRKTLNEHEQLISPADYVRIDITEKLESRFPDFAAKVCEARLRRLAVSGTPSLQMSQIFPDMSEEAEADLLGVERRVQELCADLDPADVQKLEAMTSFEAYFVIWWAKSHNEEIHRTIENRERQPNTWRERYGNYKYALLFTIRKDRRDVRKRGLHKFYSGWSVLTKLAASNIRYLLELVDNSLAAHLRDGGDLSTPVGAKTQTVAAQAVGKKNLAELEGLSIHGAKLTKLLLGLGRIFSVMAAQPEGHTPEVNQFSLIPDRRANEDLPERDVSEEVEQLLQAAVMHLALVRFPGNKLQDSGETKDYDYMIHPVFAPFFEFSHRKKRSIHLASSEIWGLVTNPKDTIESILKRQHRGDEPLPEQLRLFEGYYGNRS